LGEALWAETPSGVGTLRDDHFSETGNKLLVIIVQNWFEELKRLVPTGE